MTPFFISHIPASAEFIAPGQFLHLPDAIDKLQVIDSRLSPAVIESRPPDELVEFFRIKDRQLSNKESCVAVCGLTIFKQVLPYRQPFSDYLEGLKAWINFIRSESPDHLLWVYVGNSAWADLHREGILKAKDVHFIRMQQSSNYSKLGQFWRNLVFSENEAAYRYIRDIDNVPKTHTEVTKLEKYCETHHHMATLLGDITARWVTYPFQLFQKLTVDYVEGSPPHLMGRVSDLFKFAPRKLCNGSLDIPYNLGLVFAHCLAIKNVQTLYHPSLNVYTKIKENRMNLDSITIDEQWIFYVSRFITTKYHVKNSFLDGLRIMFSQYPCLKRLFLQIIDDGSVFVDDFNDESLTVGVLNFTD